MSTRKSILTNKISVTIINNSVISICINPRAVHRVHKRMKQLKRVPNVVSTLRLVEHRNRLRGGMNECKSNVRRKVYGNIAKMLLGALLNLLLLLYTASGYDCEMLCACLRIMNYVSLFFVFYLFFF